VRAIEKQLKQYAELNWNQLIEQDPVQAMQLQQAQRALEAERSTKVQSITQRQNEQALAEQRTNATLLQDAEAYVRREIPNWSPERTAQINAFAAAQGVKMDPETARFLLKNPAFFKVMHQAEMFDQLSKKQSAAKPATPAAPPAPVTRVGASRASAAKDPSKMSDSEWLNARKEQMRKR
jgi:membrane protease subunit (stomatin/prohibitin family)